MLPDMETSLQYGGHSQNPAQDSFLRPRRWACDYCQVATFVSYEEACSHEEACARQYYERYGRHPHPSRGPVPQYDRPQQQQLPPQTPPQSGQVTPPHGNMGSFYGQEMGGRPQMWGGRGGPQIPPLGPTPHDSGVHPHHQYAPHPSHQHHH